MTLKTYMKSLGAVLVEDFAKRCGTSVAQLKQIANGHRKAREALAINIEHESGGAVRCEDLRPDVNWQYIRNVKPKRRSAA